MTLEFTYVCDSWPLYLGQPKRGVFQALSRDKKNWKKKKDRRKEFSLSRTCLWLALPLMTPCLENPRDRGTWWAAISGVTQSRTRLKRLSSSSSSHKSSKSTKRIFSEFFSDRITRKSLAYYHLDSLQLRSNISWIISVQLCSHPGRVYHTMSGLHGMVKQKLEIRFT